MNCSKNKINAHTYNNNFNILIILGGDFFYLFNFFTDGTNSVVAEFVVTIETIKTWFVTVIMRNIRIHNLSFFFLGKALNQSTYHIIALVSASIHCFVSHERKLNMDSSVAFYSILNTHSYFPILHQVLIRIFFFFFNFIFCWFALLDLSLDLTKTLHGFMHWTKDSSICNPFWDSSELLKALVSTSNPFRFSFLIGCVMTCCSCFKNFWHYIWKFEECQGPFFDKPKTECPSKNRRPKFSSYWQKSPY